MVIFNKKIKIFMSEGLRFVEAQELCQKEISLFFSSIQYLPIKSIYFAYTLSLSPIQKECMRNVYRKDC